jgi:A/G-specific adenine glycosylase
MQKQERIHGFSQAIWEWYGAHKRALPWRDMPVSDDNDRAYRVLVSEIMLQQTQVSRVIIVFTNFLEQFPSLQSLAGASNSEIILAWRGMGYNSRALRLRDAAKTVVTDFGGVFPRDMETLLRIKGLGPYTASAIRNFAFNIPTPCIDTNIRRILHRTFVGPENADGTWSAGDRELMKLAQDILDVAITCHTEVLPQEPRSATEGDAMVRGSLSLAPHHDISRDAKNWHAALMDYGSLVQTKNYPKWEHCILTERGLMKTTPQNWVPPVRGAAKEKLKKEPGRFVGSTYIPNRIFRGKIVEALRDAEKPMSAEEIGAQVCIDWAPEHKEWLQGLVDKLVKDALIARKERGYILA